MQETVLLSFWFLDINAGMHSQTFDGMSWRHEKSQLATPRYSMTLCNWNICKIMQNLIIFCISSCRTPAFTRNMFTNFEKQACPASLCFLNYCWRFCNVYIFSACFSESRDKNGSFKQIFKVLQIVLLAQKGPGSFMLSAPRPLPHHHHHKKKCADIGKLKDLTLELLLIISI